MIEDETIILEKDGRTRQYNGATRCNQRRSIERALRDGWKATPDSEAALAKCLGLSGQIEVGEVLPKPPVEHFAKLGEQLYRIARVMDANSTLGTMHGLVGGTLLAALREKSDSPAKRCENGAAMLQASREKFVRERRG